MSVIINRTIIEGFIETQEEEVARMKARMTPEELEKYKAEQRAAEEFGRNFLAITVFVCVILFVTIVIWAISL